MTEPHNIVINLAPGSAVSDGPSLYASLAAAVRRAERRPTFTVSLPSPPSPEPKAFPEPKTRRAAQAEEFAAEARFRRDLAREALAGHDENVAYWERFAAEIKSE